MISSQSTPTVIALYAGPRPDQARRL